MCRFSLLFPSVKLARGAVAKRLLFSFPICQDTPASRGRASVGLCVKVGLHYASLSHFCSKHTPLQGQGDSDSCDLLLQKRI